MRRQVRNALAILVLSAPVFAQSTHTPPTVAQMAANQVTPSDHPALADDRSAGDGYDHLHNRTDDSFRTPHFHGDRKNGAADRGGG